MRLTQTRIAFLVCVLVANLALAGGPGARSAYACTCEAGISLEEELESSDAVFSGEVTSIEEDELAPGGGPPLGRVTFDVNESWKGVTEGTVSVYGQGDGNFCGLDFDPDKSYLVYAYRTGDHLETGLCTATKPLAEAREDLRLLGPPTSSLPDTGGPEPPGALGSRTASAVTVSALLVLAGALFLRQRSGRTR